MLNQLPPAGSRRWGRNLNRRCIDWTPIIIGVVVVVVFVAACKLAATFIANNYCHWASGGLIP